jgi:hypothetical protein
MDVEMAWSPDGISWEAALVRIKAQIYLAAPG